MKIVNDLIGHYESDSTLYFSGSDSEEDFNKNLKSQPTDWYYRNANITYKYNRFGHRSKNVEEIDQDNYILFAGCSHTEGVGLELEKTYPYLLSEKLKCDYYNIAVGGTGVDVLTHNLTIWLNKYKKPKLLIVQWPIWSRYVFLNDYDNLPLDLEGASVVPSGPWRQDKDQLNFLLAGEKLRYFKTRRDLARLKINSFDVPKLHTTLDYMEKNVPEDYIMFPELDQARDSHYGILSHQTMCDILYERINK